MKQELTEQIFEDLIERACQILSLECIEKSKFTNAKIFETRVRELLSASLVEYGIKIDFNPHPYLFPDIVVEPFGVEVKYTEKDTWRSVANSIFESTRSENVRHIYVVFGKMGGEPKVDWDKYENCVIHVRTSHVPRFELQIHPQESLFKKIDVSYSDFARLDIHERMKLIRKYARKRLKNGERLWWLEDKEDDAHSLPMQARLYMTLDDSEKRTLRAEAALLCPQIVKPSRSKHKYDDAALFLLTYHGVLCPQTRDLFSAGSVAMVRNQTRGGNYVLRALLDIEIEMRDAASKMDDALFIEYWGKSVPPENRITEWLVRADELAVNWTPSKHLFINN